MPKMRKKQAKEILDNLQFIEEKTKHLLGNVERKWEYDESLDCYLLHTKEKLPKEIKEELKNIF